MPIVIKARFNGFHGDGTTEIINAEGEIVLKAKLGTFPKDVVSLKGGLKRWR